MMYTKQTALVVSLKSDVRSLKYITGNGEPVGTSGEPVGTSEPVGRCHPSVSESKVTIKVTP